MKAAKERILEKLQEAAEKALFILGKKNCMPEIFLESEEEMSRLEKIYLKKDKKEVNVLSFPEPEGFPRPDSEKKILGQIYLNFDLNGKDFERLRFLLIHGLLHLLGYQHDGKRDTMEMEALEDELVRKIDTK